MATSRMFAPIPKVFAVSRAIARASPVLRGSLDGGFGTFMWWIVQRQHTKKLLLPIAVRPGPTESTKTASSKVVDGLVDCGPRGSGIRR